ncbi:hypothetical protein ABE424_11740 [Stenotrophomonas sp. TWI1149]|uniref:RipA family octameric membrane protein n=1 Tax=unclassified Stenotrophomonas TaxID=196198 RepID=UPI003207FB45
MTDKVKRIAELYEIARKSRDFEISQLVQRNNFFMIFQGVLLAGLAQASASVTAKPIVSFCLCLAGVLISVLQVGMAAGAKFWQERWEDAVERVERQLLLALRGGSSECKGACCNGSESNGTTAEIIDLYAESEEKINEIVRKRMGNKRVAWLVNKRFSTSRIPIYAALSLVVVWGILLACTVSGPLSVPSWIRGF